MPYVELARYVAEYRNHHWEFVMSHRKPAKVILSTSDQPYPTKTDEISDKVEHDAGRNFGRIARTGIMDDFADRSGNRLLSGIPARHWRRFLKIFTETATEARVEAALARFAEQVTKAAIPPDDLHDVQEVVDRLVETLWPRPSAP